MGRAAGELSGAGAVDVVPLLAAERADFVELLASLDAGDWDRPTECPAWSVKGVALHVLGDDLSLLARQRDGMVPSVLTEPSQPSWDGAPSGPLDRFNERWVLAATFLSPALIVELLRLTGEWTHAWYAAVDPNAAGEVVLLMGPDPSAVLGDRGPGVPRALGAPSSDPPCASPRRRAAGRASLRLDGRCGSSSVPPAVVRVAVGSSERHGRSSYRR